MVICLERGADLHMAQLMPLPLTVSCFSKIQIGFTFWYRLTRVVLEKGSLNGCVTVYAVNAHYVIVLSTGDALPPVDPNCLRLYKMRFCPYAHRTVLILKHKKIP